MNAKPPALNGGASNAHFIENLMMANQEEMAPLAVAFFVDRNAEIGLHVTITSLLWNWSPDVPIRIWVFHESEVDKTLVERTVAQADREAELILRQFDARERSELRNLPRHQGSLLAYGRLLLPELCEDPAVLYLDADLIINRDLSTSSCGTLNEYPIGAVCTSTAFRQLDRKSLFHFGFSGHFPYFNSGVLWMNLDVWREEDLTRQCLDWANRHSVYLTSHDQTILNILFRDRFFHLPGEWNVSDSAMQSTSHTEVVYHCIGMPKPWSLFGEFLHPLAPLYSRYLERSAMRGFRSHRAFGRASFASAWRSRGGYWRALKRKLTEHYW